MIRNVLLSAALTALAFTATLSYGFISGRISVAAHETGEDYLEQIASRKER